MSRPRVAYYAHHMGTGHLRHAATVHRLGIFDLQVLSTGPRDPQLLDGVLHYVPLPADTSPGQDHQPVIGRHLHYAPTGGHIADRFAILNQAWHRFRPELVMVDVSVEVAIFAKLSGYQVAFRRMPGDRTDPAHQLAYDIADCLFAYYPRALEDAAFLERFGDKTYYTGMLEPCRTADGTAYREGMGPGQDTGLNIVVQSSLASAIRQADLARAAREIPQSLWQVAGSVAPDASTIPRNLSVLGVVEDPMALMMAADLVISSAGHNAIACAAASLRPVLLVPEDRPFEEQYHFARALNLQAGIPMRSGWQDPAPWHRQVHEAAAGDGHLLAKALFTSAELFTAVLDRMVRICSMEGAD